VLLLNTPEFVNFEELCSLSVIKAMADTPLGKLLFSFINGSLADFEKYVKGKSSVLKQNNIKESEVLRKMRLFSLVSLGLERLGEKITYNEISSRLEINPYDVAMWVVDGIFY
jgi:hypothetical protein